MKLIDGWRQAWRFWSVQLAALGTFLTGILIAFPEVTLQAWALLPADLKGAIPPQYVPLIGVAVFAASIIARLVQQRKLQQQQDAAKVAQAEKVCSDD